MRPKTAFSPIIWIRSSPPPTDHPVILWNSYGFAHQHPDTVSLPLFIEENADAVRERLIQFLEQAGQAPLVSDGTAISDFVPSFGPSLWWMALSVIERLGDLTIPHAAKCIAVDLILGDHPRHSIVIESDDKRLRDVLLSCIVGVERPIFRARRLLKNNVTHQIRALLAILNYVYCTSFQPSGMVSDFHPQQEQFIFFDYLKTTYMNESGGSIHTSSFWGDVPNLSESPAWCHVYPVRLSRRKVRRSLDQLRHLSKYERNQHILFLKPPTMRDLGLILAQYFKNLKRLPSRARNLRKSTVGKSRLLLWHLFDDKWTDSLIGSTAIMHLVTMQAANALAGKLGANSRVYYLMENQAWEFAIMHSVRLTASTTAIGVPHSTIRFWDVRYFNPIMSTDEIPRSTSMPVPSRILVNSLQAQQSLLSVGAPESMVQIVEAARYTYLHALTDTDSNMAHNVLVLGDFIESANDYLLTMVKDALEALEHPIELILKPHPNCAFTPTQVGHLAENMRTDSLSSLFPTTAAVVTTAGSSTAAEAVAAGLPVILVPDPSTLDYSPTLPSHFLSRARNAVELAAQIQLRSTSVRHEKISSFVLDPEFTRWRAELTRR